MTTTILHSCSREAKTSQPHTHQHVKNEMKIFLVNSSRLRRTTKFSKTYNDTQPGLQHHRREALVNSGEIVTYFGAMYVTFMFDQGLLGENKNVYTKYELQAQDTLLSRFQTR